MHRDGKTPVHILALGHVGHAILVRAKRFAMDQDAATVQRKQPYQGFEQSGFTRTVRAYDSHARAMRDLKVQVMQDDLLPVSNTGILNFKTVGNMCHIVIRATRESLLLPAILTLQRCAKRYASSCRYMFQQQGHP